MSIETPAPVHPPVPVLRNGDRLTRDEFEQRYEALPHHVKAELLEGVVYMPSPVSFVQHGGPQFNLIGWLSGYSAATPGVRGGDNASLRLDLDNEPQPDAFLVLMPEYGGQVRIDKEGYIQGAPELVAEISASSVSYDLHVKLNVYRRSGVREYLVWRVDDGVLDWFVLRAGRYEPLPRASNGQVKSEVFPGLWLDSAALLKGDLAGVNQVVQNGIASPEHAIFVTKLKLEK